MLCIKGVYWNGSSHGIGIPMGFPREWELDLHKDGNGKLEHNNMGVKTVNACRVPKLDDITLHFMLFVGGFHIKTHSVIYFCLL